jgi:hypothetical protein
MSDTARRPSRRLTPGSDGSGSDTNSPTGTGCTSGTGTGRFDLEVARQNVTRSLTDEECRQYLHQASSSATPSAMP